jgi:hypothetical protein
MSRRVFLLGAGLTLVAMALAVTDWALSLQPGVTERNVRLIRPGMTLAEVEAIFGEPGYAVAGSIQVPSHPDGRPLRECEFRIWQGQGLSVCVWFEGARVAVVEQSVADRDSVSPLARLRAWLGW